MKKIIFIAGNSGSGKSYMTTRLVNDFPDIFRKLPQYTTRPKRENEGNEYIYTNKEYFNSIKDTLIATTEVNGNFYGTKPEVEGDSRTGIVIVNALGLKNGINDLNTHYQNIDYGVIFLDNDEPFESRKDKRDIDKEIKDLKEVLKNISSEFKRNVQNNKNNPITPLQLKEIIENI